ncbi:MAG: pentapeptide repeat-containing protein [Proteobacteria bacterium]|nr:pentapeptide repeat-containing protein [Pseudomonadota bacterium]NOG59180.1 pentapeptide repeat-containing protein [Pseudomonadota bacterium]
MAERRLWFVKRNGEIKGPFLSAQITRNILLGRLRYDDEISPDEHNWQKIDKHRELYPDVLQETPVDEEKLEIAKMQVDERVSEKRRQKNKMAQERRKTRERRGTESEIMLVHRENRNSLKELDKKHLKRPKLPVTSIALLIIVMMVFGFVLKPQEENGLIDCSLPAGKGVNWHHCHFINLNIENQNLESAILTEATLNGANLMGVNLSGADMAYAVIKSSDLSYANLERVRLIGANLTQTDIRYANLKNADLSYADLTGAQLAGADLSNAQFNNTIWTDGRQCKKGSVGSCR